MADTQKKFLDSAGVSILWNKIKSQITSQVDPVSSLATEAKGIATQAAVDIETLESYVGTIPTGYSEENVVAYIDKKAEETLAAASGNSSETAASVKQQLDSYKTENNAKVQANTEAIGAIQADYLTSTDKTNLQNQINTIINNPDTEGVINSINEFTDYINEHGEIAEGFRTDIDALENKVDTGSKNVSVYVADAIAAANHASADELNALKNKVDTGDQTVTAYVAAQTDAAKTSANQYTDSVFEKIVALSEADINSAITNV